MSSYAEIVSKIETILEGEGVHPLSVEEVLRLIENARLDAIKAVMQRMARLDRDDFKPSIRLDLEFNTYRGRYHGQA